MIARGNTALLNKILSCETSVAQGVARYGRLCGGTEKWPKTKGWRQMLNIWAHIHVD